MKGYLGPDVWAFGMAVAVHPRSARTTGRSTRLALHGSVQQLSWRLARGEAVSYAASQPILSGHLVGCPSPRGLHWSKSHSRCAPVFDACSRLILGIIGPRVTEWESHVCGGVRRRIPATVAAQPRRGAVLACRTLGTWTSARCRDGNVVRVRRVGARHAYQQVIDSGYPEFARRAGANLSAL